MVKANPWLRTLLRAGRQQQRTTAKAFEILLAPPKPAKAKAVAKPKARTPARKSAALPAPSSLFGTALVAPLQRRAEPATVRRIPLAAPGPARGKWLTSHYSGPRDATGRHHRLSYWLYLPDRPMPPGGFPLAVMLHGCDQSATLFAQGTRMNQHADRTAFAVLYPQQSATAHPHRCWHWFDHATQQGGGEVPVIAGMIRKVLDAYPIDRTRIYIGGLSAGAALAHIIALNHPEMFAAMGLHSGPLFGGCHGGPGAFGVMQRGAGVRASEAIAAVLQRHTAFPPMPTILIQGEEDPVVRQVNQIQLEQQAMLLNRLPASCKVVVTDKPGNRNTHPHTVRDVYQGKALMLRVVRIAELKHAWSGGDERLAFNSGAGPDASALLLDFFGRHRRVVGMG